MFCFQWFILDMKNYLSNRFYFLLSLVRLLKIISLLVNYLSMIKEFYFLLSLVRLLKNNFPFGQQSFHDQRSTKTEWLFRGFKGNNIQKKLLQNVCRKDFRRLSVKYLLLSSFYPFKHQPQKTNSNNS